MPAKSRWGAIEAAANFLEFLPCPFGRTPLPIIDPGSQP
jgi:hypothetical protein